MSETNTKVELDYCEQLESNLNEAINLSPEEVNAKLDEYPALKPMFAAFILLVEQRKSLGKSINVDDWDSDLWNYTEKTINAN